MIAITKLLNYCSVCGVIALFAFSVPLFAETPKETATRIAQEEQAAIEKFRKTKIAAEVIAKKKADRKAIAKAEEIRKANETLEASKVEKAHKAKIATKAEETHKANDAAKIEVDALKQQQIAYEQEQIAIRYGEQQQRDVDEKYQQEKRAAAETEEAVCRSREGSSGVPVEAPTCSILRANPKP